MKIEYSKEADAIYVYFKEEYVAKSKEIEDGNTALESDVLISI